MSDVHECSDGLKWLHLPWKIRQLAVNHNMTDRQCWPWFSCLCDMWSWKWHQLMSFGCFQFWQRIFLPFCSSHHSTLHPYIRKCLWYWLVQWENYLKWRALQLAASYSYLFKSYSLNNCGKFHASISYPSQDTTTNENR